MSTRLSPLRTIVREARAADRGFIVALSEEAFAPYARNPAAHALRMLRADAGVLMAEDERTMRRLGFVVVRVTALGRAFGPWEDPSVGYVDAIAVRDDLRRRGVGRALLDAAEEHARERRAVSMSLLTAETNHEARALFARAGYRPILPVEAAYVSNQPAITMTKPIAR
ncbi:MAG: GNAT family N-acetyltransferase [Labilithrix sp.]|nr:GNAT family N-acetyltransferase [Labilithrix sp.]MCW5813173.1 GNAT family N-acetyltransferase [Labilithrix sp.]